jgi:hypothetical protein
MYCFSLEITMITKHQLKHQLLEKTVADMRVFMEPFWGKLKYGEIKPPDSGFGEICRAVTLYRDHGLPETLEGEEVVFVVGYQYLLGSSAQLSIAYNSTIEQGWIDTGFMHYHPEVFTSLDQALTYFKGRVRSIPDERENAIVQAMKKEGPDYGWFHPYFDREKLLGKLDRVCTTGEVELITRLYEEKFHND